MKRYRAVAASVVGVALTAVDAVAIARDRSSPPDAVSGSKVPALAQNGRSHRAAQRVQAQPGVSPSLKPESDSKFFKKDYPRDSGPRPEAAVTFSFPYPVIQDTSEYEKDYVKDENADNGEWKAQSDYDRLRTKVEEEDAEARKAKGKENKAKQEVSAARKQEQNAEVASKEAEAAEADAQAKLKAASDKVDQLVGKEGSSGKHMGGEIGEQVKEVNKEIVDVEGCQKKLRKAQERLKELMEAKDARQKHIDIEQKKAGGAKDKADAEYDAAQKAQYDKLDKDLEKQLHKDRQEYEEASKAFAMSEAEMRKTEAEMREAARKLKQARLGADPAGGVSVKNLASTSAFSAASAFLVALAAMIT